MARAKRHEKEKRKRKHLACSRTRNISSFRFVLLKSWGQDVPSMFATQKNARTVTAGETSVETKDGHEQNVLPTGARPMRT